YVQSSLCLATTPVFVFFFFNVPATTEIYTLSLHDALPIWSEGCLAIFQPRGRYIQSNLFHRVRDGRGMPDECHSDRPLAGWRSRSEEHTSELQSPCNLVCRLLLEKKKHNHKSSQ